MRTKIGSRGSPQYLNTSLFKDTSTNFEAKFLVVKNKNTSCKQVLDVVTIGNFTPQQEIILLSLPKRIS